MGIPRGRGDTLIVATGRSSHAEAIEWIADGHPLDSGVSAQELLSSLVQYVGEHDRAEDAIRRIARVASESWLDTASVLFGLQSATPASAIASALDDVAAKCDGGSIESITPKAVAAAQRQNPRVMETLCSVAGVSYTELRARGEGLPKDPRGRWSPSQTHAAFALIDDLVRGQVADLLPGTAPARALEFFPGLGLGRDGWSLVEELRGGGVPYEVLLAQRIAGGAWLAHRNRTSSQFAPLVAGRLCELLDSRSIGYLRSTRIGGREAPSRVGKASGCDKQVGLLALDPAGRPAAGVIFSVARDGGTASKNASRLRSMQRPRDLPVAVVVIGAGWAQRNETADLAIAFGGRIFSDQSIAELADFIQVQTGKE